MEDCVSCALVASIFDSVVRYPLQRECRIGKVMVANCLCEQPEPITGQSWIVLLRDNMAIYYSHFLTNGC